MHQLIIIFLLTIVQIPLLSAADPQKERIQEMLAPVLDQQVIAVARINLEKLDLDGFLNLPDVVGGSVGKSIQRLKSVALERQKALLEAGGTEIFVIYSLNSKQEVPVTLVAPQSERSRGDDLEKLLLKQFGTESRIGTAKLGTLLIIGSESLTRQITEKEFKPSPRPELVAGLAEGNSKSVQVVIAASAVQRRVLTELLPPLPGVLSKYPASRLVESTNWISIAADISATPTGELNVQSADEMGAGFAQEVLTEGIKYASSLKSLPISVVETFRSGKLNPNVSGSRVSVVLSEENQGVRNVTSLLTDLADKWWRDENRIRSFNNLKQLALAEHNYHGANGHFPAAKGSLEKGKPPVSWRVLLLPYLDQPELFKKYNFDEAWDSEQNKKLLAEMPAVFATLEQDSASGMTTYQVPVNKGTFGGSPEGVTIRDITDGTSNTVMIIQVDSASAVPWTKPDDFEIDPKNIAKGLVSEGEMKFYTAFGDGSARSITLEQLNRNKLSLFTINGQEVIDLN